VRVSAVVSFVRVKQEVTVTRPCSRDLGSLIRYSSVQSVVQNSGLRALREGQKQTLLPWRFDRSVFASSRLTDPVHRDPTRPRKILTTDCTDSTDSAPP